jgi:hypothetical protein
MLKRTACLMIIGLAFGMSTAMADDSGKEKAATAAAGKWLALVDEGKYAESWNEASEYFKQNIGQDQWAQAAQGARKPLGALVSRKVASASYKTSLPGAPDGEYVVIVFNTSFEHKKSGTETVTPKKEKDGAWRVCGYYIK